MARKIDLAGKIYIIVAVDPEEKFIELKEEGDKDTFKFWKSSPLFPILLSECKKTRC